MEFEGKEDEPRKSFDFSIPPIYDDGYQGVHKADDATHTETEEIINLLWGEEEVQSFSSFEDLDDTEDTFYTADDGTNSGTESTTSSSLWSIAAQVGDPNADMDDVDELFYSADDELNTETETDTADVQHHDEIDVSGWSGPPKSSSSSITPGNSANTDSQFVGDLEDTSELFYSADDELNTETETDTTTSGDLPADVQHHDEIDVPGWSGPPKSSSSSITPGSSANTDSQFVGDLEDTSELFYSADDEFDTETETETTTSGDHPVDAQLEEIDINDDTPTETKTTIKEQHGEIDEQQLDIDADIDSQVRDRADIDEQQLDIDSAGLPKSSVGSNTPGCSAHTGAQSQIKQNSSDAASAVGNHRHLITGRCSICGVAVVDVEMHQPLHYGW